MAAANMTVHVIYSATIEILRQKTVANIADGDIDLGELRNQLMKEFEVLKESLDIIRMAPLVAAENELRFAFTALQHDKNEAVLKHFQQVRINANLGFGMAVDYKAKLLAAKLLILSMMFENRFHEPDADFAFIGAQCSEVYALLLASNSVQSALIEPGLAGSVFGSGKGKNSNRTQILAELSAIRVFIYRFTGRVCTVSDTQGKAVNLVSSLAAAMEPVLESNFANYAWIKLINGRIFCGGRDSSIHVFASDCCEKMIHQLSGIPLAIASYHDNLIIAHRGGIEVRSMSFELLDCLYQFADEFNCIDLWFDAEGNRIVARLNNYKFLFLILDGGKVCDSKISVFSSPDKEAVSCCSYNRGHVYDYNFWKSTCIRKIDVSDILSPIILPIESGLKEPIRDPSNASTLEFVKIVGTFATTLVLKGSQEYVENHNVMGFDNDMLFILYMDVLSGFNCWVTAVSTLNNTFVCRSRTFPGSISKANGLFVKSGFVFVYNLSDIYILEGKTLSQVAHLTMPNTNKVRGKVLIDADETHLYCVARGILHIWDIMTELHCHNFDPSVEVSSTLRSIPVAIRNFTKSSMKEPQSSIISAVVGNMASGLAEMDGKDAFDAVKKVLEK